MREEPTIIKHNGFTFRRYPNAKQNSDRVYFSGWVKIKNERKKERYHRYLWFEQNGEIPDGHHIHHIDGNPLNNSIENLQLLLGKNHLSEHGKKELVFSLSKLDSTS